MPCKRMHIQRGADEYRVNLFEVASPPLHKFLLLAQLGQLALWPFVSVELVDVPRRGRWQTSPVMFFQQRVWVVLHCNVDDSLLATDGHTTVFTIPGELVSLLLLIVPLFAARASALAISLEDGGHVAKPLKQRGASRGG